MQFLCQIYDLPMSSPTLWTAFLLPVLSGFPISGTQCPTTAIEFNLAHGSWWFSSWLLATKQKWLVSGPGGGWLPTHDSQEMWRGKSCRQEGTLTKPDPQWLTCTQAHLPAAHDLMYESALWWFRSGHYGDDPGKITLLSSFRACIFDTFWIKFCTLGRYTILVSYVAI